MSIRTPSTAPANPQGGPPSEPRYPWQLFVGMLLAIVVAGAILALALGVNPLTFQKMTPEPVATPVPTSVSQIGLATPTAGVTPLAIPTLAPAVAPTPIPTPASTPATAGAAQAAQTTVAIATSAATAAPGAVGTAPPQATSPATAPTVVPTDQVEPTPVQASVSPELAAAIIQGYDNYWSVRVRASGDPNDTSLDLGSVMADAELQAANTTLSQYRQEGIAFRTTVHHQIWITDATSSAATVVDKYSGESVRLNLETKEPDGSAPVIESFADKFVLNNIDGVWKVVSQRPWE